MAATRSRNPPPVHRGNRLEVVKLVRNPYATLELDVEGSMRTAEVPAVFNVLETPIEHMFHRGEIDDRLRSAADTFRRWYEALTPSSGVVDPEKPVVDVSGNKYGVPERSADAAKNLREVKKKLGEMDYDIMCRVVAVGMPFAQVAQAWYSNAPTDETSSSFAEYRRHVAKRTKDALNIVADYLQLPLKPLAGAREGRVRFYRAFGQADPA